MNHQSAVGRAERITLWRTEIKEHLIRANFLGRTPCQKVQDQNEGVWRAEVNCKQVLVAAKDDSSKFAHNINLIETHMATTFHPFGSRLLWFLPSPNSPNWWNRDVWQCVVHPISCSGYFPPGSGYNIDQAMSAPLTPDVKVKAFYFSHKKND